MLDTKKIFPIGIGTWGIGGFAERDSGNDDKRQIEALVHLLRGGVNFVDLCYWNAEGHAVELTHQAIVHSEVSRKDLFLETSVYHYRNETLSNAKKEIELLLKKFDTNYLDVVLFLHFGMVTWGIDESIKFLSNLVDEGICRYVGVSNSDLKTLKHLKAKLGDKLLTHEVQFNFEIRNNEDLGIIDFADKNGIKNVIYQPLRRNRTAKRNWLLLIELAEKYKRTQNQIIMNWIVSRGYLPITKSENIKHINETLGSLNFKMEESDLERLNKFRVPNFKPPKIDWKRTGDGVRIDQLSNVFDEEYDKQVGK